MAIKPAPAMAEHEHRKSDGLGESPGIAAQEAGQEAWRDAPRNQRLAANKIECNACPVLCQISDGKVGACDRYANQGGLLVRVDPVLLLRRRLAGEGDAGPQSAAELVPFLAAGSPPAAVAAGLESGEPALFVTAVGASTTYPDYKPAPFIVSSLADGVDMVTVVTEGIFSYCSLKLKIDTDRWLGPEQANVRCKGEVVGHVSTAEYGSQMLSLGGVHHITGGSKKEGRVTVDMMAALGNQQAVELSIDGGAQLLAQAGRAPVVNGVPEIRIGDWSSDVCSSDLAQPGRRAPHHRRQQERGPRHGGHDGRAGQIGRASCRERV